MKMPAGVYYIGDPCYAITGRDQWAAFCEAVLQAEEEGNNVLARYGDFYCFAHGTAHGDGEYPLKGEGRTLGRLSVDSGMLACMPALLAERYGKPGEDMVRHEFDYEFSVRCAAGKFRFGHLRVDTRDEPESDYSPLPW